MMFVLLAELLIPLPRKPPPRPPEQCVSPEARPSPGQVMTPDHACPSGMRWRVQK